MPNHQTRGRVRHALILVSTSSLLLMSAPALGQSPPASPVPSAAGVPGTIGQIDHPTDPEAVVLRMDTCCGFTMTEWALLEAPTFTLYGDNTAMFRPQPPEGASFDPLAGLPGFVEVTMTPEQVDALLSFALTEGGLQDARSEYPNPMITDLATTTFTINAGGIDKAVSVYALEMSEGAPDAAERARFAQLADLLDSFEEQVAAGNVESAEPYVPELYRATLYEREGVAGETLAWPWPELTHEDFEQPAEGGFLYGGLTPEQVAAVTTVPSGGIAGILVEGPDGKQYSLAIRPLLPGETVLPAGLEPA
jgi:hypothetical protein